MEAIVSTHEGHQVAEGLVEGVLSTGGERCFLRLSRCAVFYAALKVVRLGRSTWLRVAGLDSPLSCERLRVDAPVASVYCGGEGVGCPVPLVHHLVGHRSAVKGCLLVRSLSLMLRRAVGGCSYVSVFRQGCLLSGDLS